jgi:glycosyltransferase involved in cell wall biosynthesis
MTVATVVFADKSRVLAGAERSLCVLIEHLDKSKYCAIVATDYPFQHHEEYRKSGATVCVRATGLKWWMGTDRWQHPPRGTDAIKRIILAWKLRKIMAACDGRILHVNLLSRNSWVDLLAARSMGVRTVGHVRSLQSQRHLNRRCLELCDAVVCISDYVKREIAGLVEVSKIERVYNPIAVVEILGCEERHAAKCELGLNPNVLVISSVAMLDPRKGHDVAILAFAKLSAYFPRTVLLIVGGGYSNSGNDERERLQRIAVDAGVGSRVRFCGYVTRMRKVYAASDIVLALSKDGEALGLVTLEAAAHGRVAIATAAGATPEIVYDGITGFLTPPNDPDAVAALCKRVLSDGDLARRIGIAGRQHVARNFNPDGIARQVERLYEHLLKP